MPTQPSSKQISFLPDDLGSPATDVQSALREALAGGGAAPVIAVLGDSITESSTARTHSWPELLQGVIQQAGDDVKVVNLAHGGATFLLAKADNTFGGTTMVAKAIALNPAVVIVQLGYNDAATGSSSGTLQSHAQSVLTELRAGLPDAKILFFSEVCHDSTNVPFLSALTNEGCLPYDMELRASGLLTGVYCEAMLSDAASVGTIAKLDTLKTINTAIGGFTEWDGVFAVDYWKIARLGCTMADGLHPTFPGMQLLANTAATHLAASTANTLFPKFTAMSANILDGLNTLFDMYLTAGGGRWVPLVATPDRDKLSYEMGVFQKFNPDSWFYPYRTKFSVHGPSGTNAPLHLLIKNGPPSTAVTSSTAGAAFVSSGNTTSVDGDALITIPAAFAGEENLIKVGNEVYGPFDKGDSTDGTQTLDDVQFAAVTATGVATLTISPLGGNTLAVEIDGTLSASSGFTVGPYPFVLENTGIGTWLSIAGVLGVVPGTGIAPTADNTYSCGGIGYRWSSVYANTMYATTGFVTTSDERAKKDIYPSLLGLEFIDDLRPVAYRWKTGTDTGTYHGLLAQDVEAALNGRDFAGLVLPEGADGAYGLRYTEFIAPLIRAVQELKAQNQELSDRILALEAT